MSIRYGSVCSGIEAASVAWHSLGWSPAFFAEIEKFPSAVLSHRFPHVPNLGDFTKIKASDVGPIDLLVGGTPCQSFSIAGKRLGLDDPRGNLALEFCLLARRLSARWVVWENVPGVHSSWSGAPDGEDLEVGASWGGVEDSDFGAFLDALEECGYSACWRILDTQYVRVDSHPRAAPQRRERVLVVGYLGDWRPPAAVLLEPEGLRGDTPPRREAGKAVAGGVTTRAGNGSRRGDGPGNLVAGPVHAHHSVRADDAAGGLLVAGTLGSNGKAAGTATGQDAANGLLIPLAFGGNNTSGPIDVATACRAKGGSGHGDFETETFVAHAPLAIAFDPTQITSKENRSQPGPGAPCHALNSEGKPPTLAFNCRQDPLTAEVSLPINTDGTQIGVQQVWAVRRLTPLECERLQGFPDHWTAIPYRGKPAADGPRYKAIGNSMSINVMRWVGLRIQAFLELTR